MKKTDTQSTRPATSTGLPARPDRQACGSVGLSASLASTLPVALAELTTVATNATEPTADEPVSIGNRAAPGAAPQDATDPETPMLRADLIAAGDLTNAEVTVEYSAHLLADAGIGPAVDSLRQVIGQVNMGDLSAADSLLTAQAVALNAIFGLMCRRATRSQGSLDSVERYLRMAMKAQNQCRMTLETLSAIKNPPVVYARQANINNGGQQQVNNGQAPNAAAAGTHTLTGAGRPNELFEDGTHASTQMDTRAAKEAGREDPGMAPMGALDRASLR